MLLLRRGRFPLFAGRNLETPALETLWKSQRWGTGVTVVGQRDEDAETQTYITTLGLFLFGLPIIFLKAYRVLEWETGLRKASAPEDDLTPAIVRYCELRGEWYFIGQEPLSGLARGWNVIAAIAADGVTKLSHEIREWDSKSHRVCGYVKIPRLSPHHDTLIFLYYGNPTASNQEDRAGVRKGYSFVGRPDKPAQHALGVLEELFADPAFASSAPQ